MSDAALAALDGLADEMVATVSEVVRIPSITPRYPGVRYDDVVGAEGDVARVMSRVYESAQCEVDVFGQEPGRDNCVGVLRGSGGGRSLILNGHVDVVPPGPLAEWTDGDPWSGRVDDHGRLWGRGSCDMKAGLVAQAFAARALAQSGTRLRGDLILQAVVGEEMMEHELGTTACLRRGYVADGAVVGEPTAGLAPQAAGGISVAPVTPGLVWIEVAVQGLATHTCLRGSTINAGGAGATAGVNAIDKAILLHRALSELEREWALVKSHPLFPAGSFAICPGVFVGSPASGPVPFAIPDVARIDYLVWHHPDETEEAVVAEVSACVEHAAALDGWLSIHPPAITVKHRWPRSAVAADNPLVTATAEAHRRASGGDAALQAFPAVHDATYLNAGGVPAIGYGPGDLRAAHAIDEHVRVDEILLAARTMVILAAQWCGVHTEGAT